MLFVGYGLAEMEILEYVLRKNPGKPPSQELRHFALFPYQSSEKTLVRYLALYFIEHFLNA